MDIRSALNIIRPKTETLNGIKDAFKELIKEWHPDVNTNGLKMSQTILEAYEVLLNAYEKGFLKGAWRSVPGARSSILDEMEVALNTLKNCNGLEVEVCGTWIWIGGNTKYWSKFLNDQREITKTGSKKLFFWSGNKQKWYFKPSNYVKRSREIWSMGKIRASFGSERVDSHIDREELV